MAGRRGSSTSAPPSTPTPILTFENLPQPITCTSAIFTWVYTGPDDPLMLTVTNVGVPQNDPPSPSTTSRNIATTIVGGSTSSSITSPSDVTETIATNLTPRSFTFTWTPVNVAQGWYIVSATIPEQLSQPSSPFFVHTGSNTSCLTTTSSSTNSPTITPSPTPSLTTSVASQSTTPTPVSDVSSSTVRVRTIVGVCVGMAVLVVAAIAAWIYISRRARSRSGGKSSNWVHRWNGLSSNDSRVGFSITPVGKGGPSSRSPIRDSAATSMGPDFEGAEKNTIHLTFNGKVSSPFEEQGVALSTLPVLHHQTQRMRPTHTYSASSSTLNILSMNDQGALPVRRSSVRDSSVQRRPSDSSSAYPPQALRDSAHYLAAPEDMSRTHSLGTTTTSIHPSSVNLDQPSSYPSSSISISPPSSSMPSSSSSPPGSFSPSVIASRETKQMNRQSLGRKRKPVPVYDPDGEPVTPISPTFAQPPPSAPPLAPLTFSVSGDSVAVPQLAHKSSFGPGGIEGKPLHYLIPDMPMPVDR